MGSSATLALTSPIVGIENRTAQEVFDIMCDRFRLAARPASDHAGLVERLRNLVDDQDGGDAVVLVQRQLFNKVVGALAREAARTFNSQVPYD